MPDPDEKNSKPMHVLHLYITGAFINPAKAITNTKQICKTHLKDAYQLEMIDVYQSPNVVKEQQIIASPLLIKSYSLAVKRLVGNMWDAGKVLKGWELL